MLNSEGFSDSNFNIVIDNFVFYKIAPNESRNKSTRVYVACTRWST